MILQVAHEGDEIRWELKSFDLLFPQIGGVVF